MESTTQIFLLFDVPGQNQEDFKAEGRIDRYENRIMVDSFTFGMTATENTVRDSKEKASSNVKPGSVHVTRPFDTASNRVSKMLAKRTKFDEARLTVDQQMTWGRGEEREQNAIIVFHLWNGHVVDQKFTAREADKGAAISETIELSFKNVAIEYYVLNRERYDSSMRNYREKTALPFETHEEDDSNESDD